MQEGTRGPVLAVTTTGRPVHASTKDHLPDHSRLARFNKWLAVKITNGVGTMWCAYAFTLLACISLPAAIATHQVIILVSWLAQTFLQLVLLSIIIVGQNVQSEAADARAEKTLEDVTEILRILSLDEPGGLAAVVDEIRAARKRDAGTS